MSEKSDFKSISIKIGCYAKVVQIQSQILTATSTRPSLSDVIEQLCNAYLEGQK